MHTGCSPQDGEPTLDWFPIFGPMAGRRMHPTKVGWGVRSNPNPSPGIEAPAHLVTIVGPGSREDHVDLRRIPRDGAWQDIVLFGELVPIRIGWYRGGRHKGYVRDPRGGVRRGRYLVPAGYYGLWT